MAGMMDRIAKHSRACARWVGIIGFDIAACILALAVWAVLASGASAETRVLPFEVAWGEITLVDGAIAFEEIDGRFAISGAGRTRGPLNLISPWSVDMRAEGRLDDEGRFAEEFYAESESRDGPRKVTVWYDDGRPAGYEATPRRDEDDEPRTPVDPGAVVDVADALSVFATGLDAVRRSDGADCSMSGRIWDGVRLFQVRAETLGPGSAPADRGWGYAGPTLRCQLFFQRLGGFQTESGRWRSPEDETLRILHFAKVDEAWLPVRIEVSSPLGAVVARVRIDEAARNEASRALALD